MNELRHLWYLVWVDCVPCMLAPYTCMAVLIIGYLYPLKILLEWIDYTLIDYEIVQLIFDCSIARMEIKDIV